VGRLLLNLRSAGPARNTAIVVAIFFYVASFCLAYITELGHYFSVSLVAICILSWVGGLRLGILLGVIVPISSIPISIGAELPMLFVARDTFVFAFIALLCGGSIGVLTMLFEYVARTQRELRFLYDILPICGYCHKIRHDDGQWSTLESFFHHHSETRLSHGICPECLRTQIDSFAGNEDS